MPDIFGSVRRSLVLRSSNSSSSSSTRDEGREGSLVEKIGSCLRNSSLGILSKLQKPQTSAMGNGFPIRWRKGELIGCGAYGRVYMGMNLDSGELLAVKQVSIATKKGQREKAQGHILELEEEVKLLKNLSHPNIVRYLGTAREEENLNILLEFVPGGSISSLLGKFGSFPEPVIRKYTTQLLKGLEYLHRNKIIHRDIKGANILVDNKGCIKLTDFGASKKAVELATVSSTRSVKGTPYWMAPEVILQTGHSFPADIWSVGCTVIEMATGKPPWSEQYQEVAALFHIGTTKSHPPIPEHLSWEAKDFLLKCLQKEPELRPAASDLLQHPFVTREYRDHHPILCPSLVPHQEHNPALFSASGSDSKNPSANTVAEPRATYRGLRVDCNVSNMKGTTTYSEELAKHGATSEASNSDDLCQIGIDDDHEVDGSLSPDNALALGPFSKSFNPISIPVDDWQCKFDESLEPRRLNLEGYGGSANGAADSSGAYAKRKDGIPFPSETSVSKDDDEVTESKIRAFLDETVMNLKKLQTPLCEEFYNTLNSAVDTSVDGVVYGDDATNDSKISSTSRSPPSRVASGTSTSLAAAEKSISPSSCRMRISSNSTSISDHILREIPVSQLIEQRELLESQEAPNSSSLSCSERQKKWKEELDQELETHREMRRASVVRKTSFPKDRGLKRPRDPSWDATPDR